MSAAAQSARTDLRLIVTSVNAAEFAVAGVSAVVLSFAFPKASLSYLAFVGAAGLFWSLARLSWQRAFFCAWFAGIIFFAIDFSWFAYSVGRYVEPFGPLLVLVPAIVEGFAFALAGAAIAVARARTLPALWPLAAAAAFTVFEWLRSIGELGVPFGQLGYTQADTPLRVFAAYAGTYGITFVICAIGAYGADALLRRRVRAFGVTVGVLIVAWIACYAAWPARHAPPPTVRVAAIQGNIAQSVKWNPAEVPRGVTRYVELSQTVRAFRPVLVVWPETVVATVLDYDNAPLVARLSALTRSLHTTLVVGSQDYHDNGVYNALYTFARNGVLESIYDKRRLVPFAESFPGRTFLHWLPYSSLIGGFASGTVDSVVGVEGGYPFAPLICWESAFADLTHAQVRDGAKLLVIATDDAWFGKSSGPYQHAQIAQLRAVENGMWVLRAGSTGISGIIAPDGHYVTRTQLDTEAVVEGEVGAPVYSFFAAIGPRPVGIALIVLYVALLLVSRAVGRREV